MAKKSETTKKAGKTDDGLPLMRKVSARNVTGKSIKDIAKQYENGSVIELFSIAGIITRTRAISTQYGDSMGFKGQFYVKRPKSDDLFDAAEYKGIEFFAPGDFEDELITAWRTRAEGVNTVKFAAKISILVTDENDKGYNYVSEPLIDAAPSNELALIAAEAFGKMPLALEAPKK